MMHRRDFIRQFTVATGGLAVGFVMPLRGAGRSPFGSEATGGKVFAPNAYLQIDPDDTVTLTCPNPEMGQGVRTMLPMIVADELGADWRRVKIVQADVDSVFKFQFSGGSLALIFNWNPLRQAGAVAREMLIAAAAQRWGVEAQECVARQGIVSHAASGRSLRFGEVAIEAAARPLPAAESVKLKSASEFTLIGRRIPNVDNHALVTGAPLFGFDLELPKMLYAAVERCAVPGGKLTRANLTELRALPGVKEVLILDGTAEYAGPHPGIAIVAETYAQALSARKSLRATWDESPNLRESSASLEARLGELVNGPCEVVRARGRPRDELAKATKRISGSYQFGFVAHATMEPQVCTAVVGNDKAEVWASSQQPGEARDKVAQLLGWPVENITVHVPRIGGGFGRRLFNDAVLEAVAIARQIPDTPVKLLWTREDDFERSYFRFGGAWAFEGGLDKDGKVCAMITRQVHLSSKPENRPISEGDFDEFSIADLLLEHHRWEGVYLRTSIRWGMWRAPGDSTSCWVQHSFLDELAEASGRDRLDFHFDFLGPARVVGPKQEWMQWDIGRMRRVIEVAAERGDWKRTRPRGSGVGLAYFRSHHGYCAQVAEVAVTSSGELQVLRITAVLDVGPIINLSGAEQQVRGGILDALSACWTQEATFEDGRLRETNFNAYQMLRFGAHPTIDVHFIQGTDWPTGLGEPPIPPTPPAVTNAIFAATGIRVRRLPISRTQLSWS